jgi:hypothetical protein
VSAADPSGLPAGAEVEVERLVHWPMQLQNIDGSLFSFSDFPRMPGDMATSIGGNADAGGANDNPSYEYNVFADAQGRFLQWDGIGAGLWIETPAKHGIFFTGYTSLGYGWYGNWDSHNDPSPAGAQYMNNIDSVLYPGEKVYDHQSVNRGGHAERREPRFYILDPSAVLATAQKVKDGTQTPADLEIPWVEAGNVSTLGGQVLALSDGDESYFDPASKRLYTLAHGFEGGSAINVWELE